MSTNVADLAVPIGDVWAVLADPWTYADWVVGAHRIRDADATWPAVGAKLHHRVGAGPLKLNDHTEVVAVVEGHALVLHAKTRPFGTAKIKFKLLAEGPARTQVTMHEGPGDVLSRLVHNPLADLLLKGRNVETLRRLERVAKARHPPATAPTG